MYLHKHLPTKELSGKEVTKPTRVKRDSLGNQIKIGCNMKEGIFLQLLEFEVVCPWFAAVRGAHIRTLLLRRFLPTLQFLESSGGAAAELHAAF